MNGLLEPLIVPSLIVVSVGLFIKKINDTPPQRLEPAFQQQMISLNVIKGQDSNNLNLLNSCTGAFIAEQVYSPEERRNKKIVVIFSGRRLKNEVPIGMQGVKDGDFIYIHLVDGGIDINSDIMHGAGAFVIAWIILGGFWWMYFWGPNYFSFLSRVLLLGFSGLLFYIGCKFLGKYSGR